MEACSSSLKIIQIGQNNQRIEGHTIRKSTISRKVLQAVAGAIRNIETVTGTIVDYNIRKDDAELLCSAMSDLWLILEFNGYTIDIDTNRLRRAIP